MKKFTTFSYFFIILVAMVIFAGNAKAQDPVKAPFVKHFYFQPNIGLTQYYGDLNKDNLFNKKMKLGFGGSLGYQFSPLFGLRGQFLKTNLYSERAESFNQKLNVNLWDAALQGTLNINELFADYNEKRFVNFYIFGGAGLTSFVPELTSLTGTTGTITSDRQNELFVPVGAGAAFRLSRNLSLNLEYGDHILFTDDKLDLTGNVDKRDHYSYTSLGLQIKFGNKDTDGDGIRDKDDLCPDVPGKIDLAGCPDKDNDGIADKDDACPDAAGKAEFKGCPDTDGDGVPDKDDACPTVPGKKDLKGCPDSDGDGIADKDDDCPNNAGKKEFNGCPDRDGDGIIDKNDECPDVKGLAQFAGCPDYDGDGIPDIKDNCPEIAGPASNKGCPEVSKGSVIQKIVYFNTDEAIVLAKNIIDLNEIVAYMNENTAAQVTVVGHTDDRESDEYNMRLSEKRADFVIDYLKNKGLTNLNILKEFYGESKPSTDNTTSEGRALNRRVVITITRK